jgi:hypothetical protein
MNGTESPPGSAESNVPAMSLGSRLMNVFVSPSEVFDEVKSSPPQAANWLVPLVAAIIAGIIYSLVVFSQPGIIQQMKEPVEQKFEQMVRSGKITQKQADQQMAMIEKFMSPQVYKVFGILGTLFAQPGMLFLMALIFWMIGRFAFHADFEYMKAVEAVGLAMMIVIPGAIVAMLLAVIYGNLAMTPGPALLVSHFDQTNPVHVLLSSLNVVFIWYIAVLAIALARLSRTSFVKAALWGFGLWGALVVSKLGLVIISKHLQG